MPTEPFYVITFYSLETDERVYTMDEEGETFPTLEAAQRFASVLGGEGCTVSLWEGTPQQIETRLEIVEYA